jgi:molybdopterin-guanine dinucleotide biosynthesis protein A
MGVDKAFVEVGGRPMVLRVTAALIGAGCDQVVVVGGDRVALMALGLEVVEDLRPGEGPLGGLVTAVTVVGDQHSGAHGSRHADIVLGVGCDLPLVEAVTLSRLVDVLDEDGLDVAVARTDRDEPLCAAWRVSTCAPVLRSCLEDGERAVHRALRRLQVGRLPVDVRELHNVNRPDDLIGL